MKQKKQGPFEALSILYRGRLLLDPSVFLILLTSDHCTGTCTNHTTDHGTCSTVLLIDHCTSTCTNHTTDHGTFGSLTPAFFLGSCS